MLHEGVPAAVRHCQISPQKGSPGLLEAAVVPEGASSPVRHGAQVTFHIGQEILVMKDVPCMHQSGPRGVTM